MRAAVARNEEEEKGEETPAADPKGGDRPIIMAKPNFF